MPGRRSKVLWHTAHIREVRIYQTKGIKVTLILTALLVMLFYKSRNIHNYFSRQFGKLTDTRGSKNPYYDLLDNE